MKPLAQFIGGLLLVLGQPGILAADQVLLNDPSPVPTQAVSETAWVRLGGHDTASLSREGDIMLWNTTAQNMILNQFAISDTTALGAGESITFRCKFRAAGIQAVPRGFQIGLFNSAQQDIPGDNPATVVNPKFALYSGYLVALDLGSQQGQGLIIYRRNAESGTNDQTSLFGLSTGNVTYLKGGPGHVPAEDEEVEVSIQIENAGSGMRITASINGQELTATDTAQVESFDTVALISYGGNTRSIAFSQCEVIRAQ